MKKYLLLTISALLLSITSSQAIIRLGIKAGVNLSEVSFKNIADDLNPSNYTGFQFGPIVEFTLPIIDVGFDAALLYSQSGLKLNDENFKRGTILVPLNLKYKLELLDIIGIYGTAGPYIDFKVYDDLDDYKEVLKNETFGAGLNFGFGAELFNKLQVGANYQLGLTDDWSTKHNISEALDAKGKTRIWTISAAFFF